MPSEPTDCNALLERARAGCPDAACQLVDRYSPHILRVICRKLPRALHRVLDAADCLQTTWLDFFAGATQEHTPAGPDELLRLLVCMAERNILDAYRHYLDTNKRDLRRQQPLEPGDANGEHEPVARQRTPDQIVSARDHYDRLLQGCPPVYQRALAMLRDGYTAQEVAEQLGLSERTIRRFMEPLREQDP